MLRWLLLECRELLRIFPGVEGSHHKLFLLKESTKGVWIRMGGSVSSSGRGGIGLLRFLIGLQIDFRGGSWVGGSGLMGLRLILLRVGDLASGVRESGVWLSFGGRGGEIWM